MWIDAICIDQMDEIERSQQVGMMKDIYSRAMQVVVFLGEEADDSDSALLALHGKRFYDDQVVEEREKLALQHLFRRHYFRRLWVIQEFLIAKLIHIICGSQSASFLPRDSAVWQFAITECECPTWIDWHCEGSDMLVRHLTELLLRTRKSSCLDPRDKVFGLLGLVGWDSDDRLTVDYSLSVAELYVGLAGFFMHMTGSLDITLRGLRPQGPTVSSLPAWIPDLFGLDDTDSFDLNVLSTLDIPSHEVVIRYSSSKPEAKCFKSRAFYV